MYSQALGKIPTRRIDQAALTLTLIVAAGLVVAFIGRGAAALKHVQGQEITLSDRLAYLNEVAAMFGEGEETLTFVQERTNLLNERLPVQIDYQSFYADLSRIAASERIDVFEVQPQSVRDEPNYLELPISIRAEASYGDLYAFLHRISTMPRLVKLHSLEVGMSDEHRVCRIDADLRIYAVKVENANG